MGGICNRNVCPSVRYTRETVTPRVTSKQFKVSKRECDHIHRTMSLGCRPHLAILNLGAGPNKCVEERHPVACDYWSVKRVHCDKMEERCV